MWLWLTIGSALTLGLYDVAKKQSLKRNGVMYVLFFATAISTLFLTPFFPKGTPKDHFSLMLKAAIVTSSWISGLAALKTLPITTASTIKATRPVFVLLLSMLIFGEELNRMQLSGSIVALTALFLLSRSSKKSEGIDFARNKGAGFMFISVFTGVGSALYDKYLLGHIDPLFVQCWTNLYITLLMGIIIFLMKINHSKDTEHFRWDWNIVAVAVFITIADALYFYALSQPDAMLSVVSMIRRASVMVPFIFGALIYHEKNIRTKAVILGILLFGMVLLVIGSS